MMRKLMMVTAALSLLSIPALAAKWNVDASHSTVGFEATHLLISKVHGQFTTYTAEVEFDEANPSSLSLNATIDAASINTQNEKRDGHLKAADFFDAANHPKITFKSTKTEVVSPGKFKVTGDLTIRDVTKPVVLDVTGLDRTIEDSWGNVRMAAQARSSISRFAYGLKWDNKMPAGDFVVSDMVDITVSVELMHKK